MMGKGENREALLETEGIGEDEEVDRRGRSLVDEVVGVDVLVKEEAAGLGAVALLVEEEHKLLHGDKAREVET